MASEEKYRTILMERIGKRAGFSPEQHTVSRLQLRRIADLAEILHQQMIIEQMVRVEEQGGRKLTARFSSKIRPAGKKELSDTLNSLAEVKDSIWRKCDSIAEDLGYDDPPDSDGSTMPDYRASNLMRCHSCGGNVSVLAYNNFKCSSCGLGYSASDYLNNLTELIEKI